MLYLGALGDRYGRKLMLVLGTALVDPRRDPRGDRLERRGADRRADLRRARGRDGLPDDARADHRAVVGPGRTKAIALWSGIGASMSALGPLLSGALLEHHAWGSVFLLTLPFAVLALVMAILLVPNHVNETTDPVDNLGGILSIVLVAGLVLAINFAPVPGKGTLALILGGVALVALVCFYLRQRTHASSRCMTSQVASRRVFWVAAVGGIVVFGSLMGAIFVGQQFLQNVLHYSTLGAGASILPAAVLLVAIAPRSAKLVESRGARFTLLVGYFFCLLGFLTMLLLWRAGIPYWKVGLAYAFDRRRRRLRRHARLALADGLGPGQARGHGLGHLRPAARPRRRDHAVDHGRAADRRLRDVGLQARSPPRRTKR